MPAPRARGEHDPVAEDRLVRQHLPLVGYLVNEFVGRLPDHVQREDMTAAGMVALAQAARGWDESTGVPFGRYAAPRIKGAFVDELRSQDWASRGARSRARRVDQARESLTASLGRVPTDTELASSLGVRVDEVGASRGEVQRANVLSLQGLADAGVDVAASLADPTAGPEPSLLATERRGYLRDAVQSLPERMRVVVEQTYFAERPLAEVAAVLGVSESRVSQLRTEALLLLKDAMNSVLDPDRVTVSDRPDGVAQRRREAYYATVASRSTLQARLAAGAVATPFVPGITA